MFCCFRLIKQIYVVNNIKIIPDLWIFCSILISVGESFHAYEEVRSKGEFIIINSRTTGCV